MLRQYQPERKIENDLLDASWHQEESFRVFIDHDSHRHNSMTQQFNQEELFVVESSGFSSCMERYIRLSALTS